MSNFVNLGVFKIFPLYFVLNMEEAEEKIKEFGNNARFLTFPEMLYLNNEIRNLSVLNLSEGDYWMKNDKKISNVYWNKATIFKMKDKLPGWKNYNYDFWSATKKDKLIKRILIVGKDVN
jgi:hypothetical protein